MALDPNIPLSMPKQPTFGEQMGEAYKMADIIQKQQQMRQQQQDSEWMQQQLKEGADIQTPEGLKKLTEAARGKVSLPTLQTLIKSGQEAQQRDLQIKQTIAQTDLAQFELGQKKNDAILNYGGQAMTQWEADREKFGEQQADENLKTNWPGIVQSAAQSGLFDQKQIQNALTWDRPQIQRQLKNSEHFQKLATEALKQRDVSQGLDIAAAEEERKAKLFPLQLQSEKQKIATEKAREAEAYAQMAKARRAGEDVKPPSPTVLKEMIKADDMVQAGNNTITALDQALEYNEAAYSGYGAKMRAQAQSNIAPTKSADATINLDNLITEQALGSLKATFGGMPTEGERKVLLEMQASVDKTPKQRAAIIARAKAAANRRITFNQKLSESLRTGEYYKPGFTMPKFSEAAAEEKPEKPSKAEVGSTDVLSILKKHGVK